MSKAKIFIENFFVYGLGGVISKIIPLIMVPMVTRLMPSESYFGISDMSQTIISFTTDLAVLGMYDAMYRMFFEKEDYAMSKSRSERFLADNPYPKNWTVVRPVISFDSRRMDLVMVGGTDIVNAKREGRKIQLPLSAKNLTAGLDWAGNSGKLIANLLFKEETIGQAYTISTAQNLTWGEIANIYTEILGVEIEWTPEEFSSDDYRALFRWKYDRAYDRSINNAKVLAATGLTPADFKSIREGILIELKKLGFRCREAEQTD